MASPAVSPRPDPRRSRRKPLRAAPARIRWSIAGIATASLTTCHIAVGADVPDLVRVEAYSFHVVCPGDDYVAQWIIPPNDPGKDYFRIATGDQNLDCSIYDYNRATDADLPRRLCDDPGGLIRGFPLLLILLGAKHCK